MIKHNRKIVLLNVVLMMIFFVGSFCFVGEAGAEERTYYQGIKVDQSYSGAVYMEPGKAMTIWVKYKNVGYYRWRDAGERTVYLKVDDNTGVSQKFYHQFWLDEETVAVLPQRTEVGEYAVFKFAISAPREIGEYLVKLRIWAYDDWMDGEDIQIKVRVGWEEYVEKLKAEQAKVLGVKNRPGVYEIGEMQYSEPQDLRVGLYSMTREEGNKVQISSTGSYSVYGAHGQMYLTNTQGEMTEVEFDYDNKRYFLNINGERVLMSDNYFVFKQNDVNNIFTIDNYYNPAYAGSSTNYNRFRGSLEVQWIEDNEKLWVINELAMEPYLKGSGESMDISPYEFLKAMAIVERSYALLHYLNPTKHEIRNFTVTASQSDQVYQGYGREIIQPNICRAVDETRGLIVTYENEIALTPYFSQSDGRTRSYEEVWHRTTYPYLVSVVDPHMEGKRMVGHGVGMSARGALFKASRDGDNFEELIYHYYRGVEIRKVY